MGKLHRRGTRSEADVPGKGTAKKVKRTVSKVTTGATQKKIMHAEPSPSAGAVFKVMISARLCAAIWSHITDCDETFNYWEPLHYLMYGQGLQTWEYSAEFSLRSYTYLLIHGVPGWIYKSLLNPNPMLVFYFIRCMLGVACACVECYFYKAISREFGMNIARIWTIFQLFSPGMFIASAALLPSSFSMYFSSAALAAWWHQKYKLAILFTVISAFMGWPFAVIISAPIAYDMLIRKRMFRTFMIWAIISAATIVIPMVVIDSSYFGKLVFAPLNLVIYNVFTSHGPNLYGVEPLSYYLINGFLNFNFIWLFALAAPVLLVIGYFVIPAKTTSTLHFPYYLSLSPLYLWLLVFFIQPHKEERFLFPVYLMVTLCGAIAVDVIQKIYFLIRNWIKELKNTHYLDHTLWIAASVIFVTILFGLSRIFSLVTNYQAPMDVMMELNAWRLDEKSDYKSGTTYNVCVGKDWYRFPNSFFFPTDDFRLRFIKSEFNGMLPAYFDEGENGTRVINHHFNDLNRGDDAMLFDYTKCHFLLDIDFGVSSKLEPNYVQKVNEWTVLKSKPFLNSNKSHNRLRSFYVPYLSEAHCNFGTFNLLKKKKFIT